MTATNDDAFFVFEDVLHQVLLLHKSYFLIPFGKCGTLIQVTGFLAVRNNLEKVAFLRKSGKGQKRKRKRVASQGTLDVAPSRIF